MDPLVVIADLLAALANAHTARTMVRAIATTLSTTLALKRVELRAPAPSAIAELVAGEWRCIDSKPAPQARLIASGLAVVPRGALPALFTSQEFRAALDQVVATAARHLETVQRVASLSRRAQVENRALREDLERLESPEMIVARSTAMRSTMTRSALVARHSTTVLLTGESGSGKEVLAREIHHRSPRAHRPMLHVNCGAIPEALVENELFGHERGAFTGADRTHVGVFERAHRGTLFLDEVGELPLAAQVKLLRVLQERQLRRVGGDAQIDVDVRLIAATNRSLVEMVAAGTFREDLFYRLDVFAIAVPPLRERKGDLAPLVVALTAQLAAKLDLPTPIVSRAVMSRLEAHEWPGNVRELMNVLEAGMILGGGRALEVPDDFGRRHRNPTGPYFDAAVRTTLEDSLRATHGKIYGPGGAAERLGLKPGTLQSKMRKLGIERSRFTLS
ncbi:MAG TPA: sigma 54-interacting transcriptional regulator [Kofleriaceae bacterium]